MKEKRFRRTIVAAAILGTSLSMSSFSCVKPLPQPSDVSNVESSYDASSEIPESVYGPPVEESSFNPSEEIPESVYGPPVEESSFNPSEEIPEPVYGPPPAEERESSEEKSFDPRSEIPVMVYGPPEMMGNR